MQLYAITDRHLLAAGNLAVPSFARTLREGWDPHDPERRAALVDLARNWARNKIDYIQIREKDLAPEDLRTLTEEITTAVRKENAHTRVLLNGSVPIHIQIALEAHADGVHLPASAPQTAAANAREIFNRSGKDAIISYACHSAKEVLKIREESQQNSHATTANTLILYAPVFEKLTAEGALPGQGLQSLKEAVEAAGNIPVFALGGVTLENAPACIAAGATGIAAIRLFLNCECPGQLEMRSIRFD